MWFYDSNKTHSDLYSGRSLYKLNRLEDTLLMTRLITMKINGYDVLILR